MAAAQRADDAAAMESAEGSTSDLEELKEDGEDWDDWDVVEPPTDGNTVEVNDGWIMSSKEDAETAGAASVQSSAAPSAEPECGHVEGRAAEADPGSPAKEGGDGKDGGASHPSGASDGSSTAGQPSAAFSDASACESVDDEPSFCCQMCRMPIFKTDDIISSNYHAQTSPGYLISVARNTTISPELQTATYTTGQYTIQEVMCQRCSATLGVTYSGAAEARNQYKVGKFLVGRDRLQLPPGVVHPMDRAKH